MSNPKRIRKRGKRQREVVKQSVDAKEEEDEEVHGWKQIKLGDGKQLLGLTKDDWGFFGGLEEMSSYDLKKGTDGITMIREGKGKTGESPDLASSDAEAVTSSDEERQSSDESDEVSELQLTLKSKKKLKSADLKKTRKSNEVVLDDPVVRAMRILDEKYAGESAVEEESAEETESPTDVDMSAWDGLHIPELILQALKEAGFSSPTPIQALTLPPAIRDAKDIVGAAETGSGKTLAFAIPILAGILQEARQKMIQALILTPTRELAIQIRNHIERVGKHTGIKVREGFIRK